MNPDPHSSHYAYKLEGRIESLESKVELLICEVKALRKQQSYKGEKTMSEPTDGGPAFPVVTSIDADAGGGDWPQHSVNSTDGMSLRDYFAAAALTGLLAHPNQSTDVPAFAKPAYHFADAMLKEREV